MRGDAAAAVACLRRPTNTAHMRDGADKIVVFINYVYRNV